MRRQGSARRVALTGVLAALALALLSLTAVAPTGRLGLTALAGLTSAAAVVSGGLGAGALCYVGVSVLAAILLPVKDAAVLFALFFGVYPLVKCLVERLRRQVVEWLLKLAFFNAVLSVFLFLLSRVLFAAVNLADAPLWAVYLGGNAVFAVYDLGLSKLITFYVRRVDRLLRKG